MLTTDTLQPLLDIPSETLNSPPTPTDQNCLNEKTQTELQLEATLHTAAEKGLNLVAENRKLHSKLRVLEAKLEEKTLRRHVETQDEDESTFFALDENDFFQSPTNDLPFSDSSTGSYLGARRASPFKLSIRSSNCVRASSYAQSTPRSNHARRSACTPGRSEDTEKIIQLENTCSELQTQLEKALDEKERVGRQHNKSQKRLENSLQETRHELEKALKHFEEMERENRLLSRQLSEYSTAKYSSKPHSNISSHSGDDSQEDELASRLARLEHNAIARTSAKAEADLRLARVTEELNAARLHISELETCANDYMALQVSYDKLQAQNQDLSDALEEERRRNTDLVKYPRSRTPSSWSPRSEVRASHEPEDVLEHNTDSKFNSPEEERRRKTDLVKYPRSRTPSSWSPRSEVEANHEPEDVLEHDTNSKFNSLTGTISPSFPRRMPVRRTLLSELGHEWVKQVGNFQFNVKLQTDVATDGESQCATVPNSIDYHENNNADSVFPLWAILFAWIVGICRSIWRYVRFLMILTWAVVYALWQGPASVGLD